MAHLIAAAACTLIVAAGSVALAQQNRAGGEGEHGGTTARAALKNASGEAVGSAMLRDTPNGVLLRATLTKLPPGTHAFHIHEIGSCEPPDFESAGGHVAPAGQQHGFLDPKGPHAGDLPNLHIPASGQLITEIFVEGVSLSGNATPLTDENGSALVVHANADDYTTNPAGDAGTRIACGVITR